MQIWSGIERFADDGRRVVATIGNFDGVHRGHREIVDRVIDSARRDGRRAVLITFEPHPLAVVAPERKPPRLQTRKQQLDALERCGLDDVVIVAFDRELAALDADAFVRQVLTAHLPLEAIHVGENFRFGKGRAGDVETLRAMGAFAVHGVAPVTVDGVVVSSSEIRKRVAAGDVAGAARLLGRPYALVGEVVHGDGRGSTIDFPTANLAHANELLPAGGVYVTECSFDARREPSVTNVGVRPTIEDDAAPRVESHLLDFAGDLYGREIEVHFRERLRDEMRFDDVEALADQIARDRAAAASYFSLSS